MIRKVLSLLWRFLCVSLLAAVLALVLTGFSPVFDFAPARAFSGPDIFDPYSGLDSALCWKRANFHTHTRVDGIFNECRHTAMETYDSLAAYGYDIVTFSNHNALTVHPFDSSLQVNVYEHGYNLFKYHKLVFGAGKVLRYDNLLPVLASQKQFQLDLLSRDADFIQMNHPFRTNGTSESLFRRLGGYRIMELDSIIAEITKLGYRYRVTEYAGQAEKLARECGEHVVVAVGGDGTVNEVGRGLLGTDKTLGIVPCGSGDGLARCLGISRRISKAVSLIESGKEIAMDVGYINGKPFFSVCGVGFDADVSRRFAESGRRGVITYLDEAYKLWKTFKPIRFTITVDGRRWTQEAVLVTVGNSNQWGNEAKVAPHADISDGCST